MQHTQTREALSVHGAVGKGAEERSQNKACRDDDDRLHFV
jgi:hypothetical protein